MEDNQATQLAQISDEQLFSQFRQGNQAAFTLLVEKYQKELYNFLLRFIGHSSSAEDVFQETFLQVYLSADSFSPEKRFRPWLYTIAANKARDLIRSRARRPTVQLSDQDEQGPTNIWDYLLVDHTTAPDILDHQQQSALIRQIVDKLPEHLRQILMLAYFSQMSYQEMAQTLIIPLGTVKSRLHSAVAAFGRLYHEHLDQQNRSNISMSE